MAVREASLKTESLLQVEKRPILDWEDLRRRSLQPGGFGSSRAEIWPKLLHVSPVQKSKSLAATPISDSKDGPEGEEKVTVDQDKDTAQKDMSGEQEHRDERQIRLDTDRSFVLYPGYHDVVSVIFLTLPEEIQLACVEKISLHRVRDSMGATLEPVLGLLRRTSVTKNLLRLVDPEYAQNLERSSPLPFYALSNLLTLFAHDMPTLPLIQHVFDYLLSRPPIAVVYLATAVILSRKQELRELEEEDEDEGIGMAHSLLSGLPHLVDTEELRNDAEDVQVEEDTMVSVKLEVQSEAQDETLKMEEKIEEPGDMGDVTKAEDSKAEEPQDPDSIDHLSMAQTEDSTEQNALNPHLEEKTEPADPETPLASTETMKPSKSSSPVPARHSFSTTLTALLTHADAMYLQYPPTHPELALAHIMGPQSVVHTWSESPRELPRDDEAEAMVGVPSLVVYPYIDDDSIDVGTDGEWEDEKKTQVAKQKQKNKGKLRRKAQRALARLMRRERRTGVMVAGAVVVLSVAMAVYGVRFRGTHAGAGVYGFVGPEGQGTREWKMKFAGWVGAAVVGVMGRVFSGFTPSAP
ncbi:hypothetical protein H0H81_007072 [Sphagnurus paluster]|uniref:Rab-GAP TBC domain-containing protein n=1 Tax=Sphagnurus paluster TaxID=117069 RepID=A0A9P7GKR1_9AGAR|nr:hypothetical protein H0H81_007072 [Sphagnurus paluster]